MVGEYFSRAGTLLGADGMARLAAMRTVVVGVGGVGSWCAEALVRTGVGSLLLIDADAVAPSNVNRQAMATASTLGRPKVEAMAERLRQINPYAKIEARAMRFCAETESECARLFDGAECIVDAIDSLDDKARLIRFCESRRQTVVSSMGAALRTDPTCVRTGEFASISGDALARALRHRFHKDGLGPVPSFKCVYSVEPALKREERGSLMQVTATFGMALASLVIGL